MCETYSLKCEIIILVRPKIRNMRYRRGKPQFIHNKTKSILQLKQLVIFTYLEHRNCM